ncbi:hypothetical protein WNY37_16795 [Henriciella sp. AS95]|uniref:hypothetical protein n=1 Tax=Henriciella sp. AS95 TaxID=3135782 RepID=UPI00316D61DE
MSLWDGWLGKERYHLLDEVTRDDDAKFAAFWRAVASEFDAYTVDLDRNSLDLIAPSNDLLTIEIISDGSRTANEFIKLIIPSLDCMITEEWDYTLIIWHRTQPAPARLLELVEQAGLKYFLDSRTQ